LHVWKVREVVVKPQEVVCISLFNWYFDDWEAGLELLRKAWRGIFCWENGVENRDCGVDQWVDIQNAQVFGKQRNQHRGKDELVNYLAIVVSVYLVKIQQLEEICV
jgi:hypothetical protein